MDLPVPVGQPPDTGEAQMPPAIETAPPAEDDPESTLAHVQETLNSLSGRLDALAESFESSVRLAVADEVHKVAGELQHTVAALGRILVRDLGKLNQILADHRDTILAEVRKGTAGERMAAPAVEPTEPAGPQTTAAGTDGTANGGDTAAKGDAAAAGDTASQSRHWRRRKA